MTISALRRSFDTLLASRRLRRGGAFLLLFSALAILRFVFAWPFPRNSDDANNLLAGIDMARGNWNLHGWVMAPDNLFFTDVLIDAILTRLFGAQPWLMQLHGAIVWALLVVVAIALSAKGMRARASIAGAIAVVTLLAITVPLGGQTFVWPTLVASHAAQILLALLAFWLAAAIAADARGTSVWRSAGLTLLVFAGSFSDPIFVEMTCVPLLAVCVLLPFNRVRSRATIAGCVLVGFFAARWSLRLLHAQGGFESVPLGIQFAAFDQLSAHLQFFFHSLLKLFGADFTGIVLTGEISNPAFVSLLRLPFLAALAFALVGTGGEFLKRCRTWPRTERDGSAADFLDFLLLFGFVLSASAVIVTTAIVDLTHVRYFLPSAVFGSILLARKCAESRLFSVYGVMAFAGSALFLSHEIRQGPSEPVMAESEIVDLAETLQSLGLHHGYAGYWQSSIVSVLSKQDIRVLALNFDGKGIFRWFTNMDWYGDAAAHWRDRIFVVGTEGGSAVPALPQEVVVAEFGKPEWIAKSGPLVINIYDNSDGTLRVPAP